MEFMQYTKSCEIASFARDSLSRKQFSLASMSFQGVHFINYTTSHTRM